MFEEYAAALSIDLCFQNFAQELSALSQMYGPPSGALAPGRNRRRPRRLRGSPQSRPCHLRTKTPLRPPPTSRHNLGRRLAESALETARALGYARIRLDTLPEMQAAQRLYESLGFRDITPYYGQPIAGQRFMEAQLN